MKWIKFLTGRKVLRTEAQFFVITFFLNAILLITSGCSSSIENPVVVSAKEREFAELEIRNTTREGIDWFEINVGYWADESRNRAVLWPYFVEYHLEPDEKIRVLIMSAKDILPASQLPGKVVIFDPQNLLKGPQVLTVGGECGKGKPPVSPKGNYIK